MMGYNGPYSLGARAASECAATCISTYLGGCIIANALLSKTKGNAMGFGWIAFGAATAVGFGICMLGTTDWLLRQQPQCSTPA